MNKRFLSVLIFAAVVSLGASLVFYRLIQNQLASAPKPPQTRIVLAARPLQIGTLIREPDIKIEPWNGPVPATAVLKKEDAIGRGVVAAIYQDEPLLDGRLAPKGSGAGLAATIPPGMRAVAVRVNEVIGVAGFVVPGMRVDVLIFGLPPSQQSNTQGTLGKTLLQNIEVLSAGQNIQKDAEGKPISVPVVNLLVTPEQAEVLSLASSETKIQLVLRNPLDTQIAKTPGTAVAKLFTGVSTAVPSSGNPRPRSAPRPKLVAPAPKPAPPLIIEVIHGNQRAQAKFVAGSSEVQQ